jgi:hypothetical protein
LFEAAQNFEGFSKIQYQNLKNQKHIAVDVLLQAFIMDHSHADPIWPDGTFKILKKYPSQDTTTF